MVATHLRSVSLPELNEVVEGTAQRTLETHPQTAGDHKYNDREQEGEIGDISSD